MRELDLRGEICPVPLIKTLEALEKLEEGEVLRVLVDMPCAKQNVPKHMAEIGHEVEVRDGGKDLEIIIRKRDGS
ncbi:sulfurtransferase TusA family protein [Candidatus Pyrohabitans sp.]